MADRTQGGNQGLWPIVAFVARVAGDGRTHVVMAAADAVADPEEHVTCCRLPAAELHGKPCEVTCAECAATSGVRSVEDFPPERVP